jgi:hypothetical protein
MKKKKIDQIAIYLLSLGLHKGRPEASREAFSAQKEHPALQRMKFINCFRPFWVLFALLGPDCESGYTDPGTPLILDPIRIRNHNTANYG